ncbi:MAG TPA: hypothetical protein VGT61_04245 [Thermomicrobiales bacterium]|jgi:hypothetical protein|nr:hypothetical protein [Thermomicrobiales bacterium]
MSVHLFQEILFILSGLILFVVALAVMVVVIQRLVIERGRNIPQKKRRGQEERPE